MSAETEEGEDNEVAEGSVGNASVVGAVVGEGKVKYG